MALTTNSHTWKLLAGIFAGLTIVFLILFYFSTIFITIVIGIALIMFTEKLVSDYRKHMSKYKFSKFRRHLIAYCLVVFWMFSIGLLLYTSINELTFAVKDIEPTGRFIQDIYMSKVQPYIPSIISERLLTEEFVYTVQGYTLSLMSDFLSKFSDFLINGVLIIPLMFYMYFKRWDAIVKTISNGVPEVFTKGYKRAMKDIGNKLHLYFKAKVIQGTVVGVICCLGFFIAGVKGWLILGLIAGFLNIVPFIGPWIGAIPPVIITLLVDNPVVVLYVIITVVIAQIVDNFYLNTFMVANQVNIDTFLSIILVLAGAKLFGVMGMVFSIPMFLIYKIVLTESYAELIKIYK